MTEQKVPVRSFQIVADKGCNLPPWLIRRFGIHIFPIDNIYNIEEDILFISSTTDIGTYRHMIETTHGELTARNPHLNYHFVDSRSAGIGYGRLLMEACELREDAVGMDETYQWVLDNRGRVCQWFLRSEAGGVEPSLLHINDSGAIVERSDKLAGLDALLHIFKNTAHKPYNKHSASIMHANNLKIAEELATLLAEQCEVTKPMLIEMEDV
ncbi:MAG: hypothetical protein FWD93_04695, partial [Coriobacteriia bacterium]|nr:hypothetical protein [Coriobacteriia bacterium]